MSDETKIETPAVGDIAKSDDNVTPIETKKKSKVDLKREEIFRERMRRLINEGKTPEQAFAIIQKEDYMRLPVAEKLELMRRSFGQSLENMAGDLYKLHENQRDLADVMDVNFLAFGRMLAKLGLPEEEQSALFKEAEAQIKADREAEAAKTKELAEEKKKQALAESVDQAGTAPSEPEGAQVFGG